MNDNAIDSPLGENWDEVKTDLYSPEEIAEGDLRVALIRELIKARKEKGIIQVQLETR